MTITADLDTWLEEAGYEYHCFISWAHTINHEMTACARRVKAALEQELALSIPSPNVFLDEATIPPGAQWAAHLATSLCRSVTMVAICAPIVFHPAHKVCGLEWAAMDNLSKTRLAGKELTSIIPLIFRRGNPLPRAVSSIEYIDLSHETLRTPRYYQAHTFRSSIHKIIERIEQIATTLRGNNAIASCEGFTLPATSAFEDYTPESQPLPFRQ